MLEGNRKDDPVVRIENRIHQKSAQFRRAFTRLVVFIRFAKAPYNDPF